MLLDGYIIELWFSPSRDILHELSIIWKFKNKLSLRKKFESLWNGKDSHLVWNITKRIKQSLDGEHDKISLKAIDMS